MDPLVALVAGSGWAAGVNLYLTVGLLGLAGRFDLVAVPEALTNPWVIGTAFAVFAAEFVVDKIPYLDSAWDAIHTFVRPAGAAFLGAVLAGDASALLQAGAASGSGLLALASHAAKATTRAAINTSPEPFTNITASLTEDVLVAAVVVLALSYPEVALVVAATLLVLGLLALRRVWRLLVNGYGWSHLPHHGRLRHDPGRHCRL
jgi:hypothetical protein